MALIECRSAFNGNTLMIDGEKVPLGPSLKLRNHSPTGFGWGYGGSGPSQTALAVLLHFTDEETALRFYMDFKDEHVAAWGPWPENISVIVDVDRWIQNKRNRARILSA